MVKNTSDFTKHCPDPLSAVGNFNVEKLFDGKREALFYMVLDMLKVKL